MGFNIKNNYGPNIEVNAGGKVTLVQGGSGQWHTVEEDGVTEYTELPDVTTLAKCAENVRQYFWGDSALAVIFCICRDCYGYANNMSQFERDFHCQEGLLSNTFRNNPYMRLHVDKWAQNGAKQRVLQLMEAYKNAVEERDKA
jgi:hypothetical protein